jgi:ABC-type glycerol-3-phosphate transport system substrate-binding protein
MKRYKALAAAAAVAVITVGLTGCSNGGSSTKSDGSGVVHVISNSGINSDWIASVIPLFEKKYPHIKVEQDAVEGQKLLTQATQIYASSSAPDVGFIQTNYPGYGALIKEGALTNLDDQWKASGLTGAVPASTSQFWEVNGHHYGIASYQVWTPVIYYNESLFSKAGITVPSDHQLTDKEFISMVDKLKADGTEPLAVGGGEFGGYHLITALMQSASPDVKTYESFLNNTQPGTKAGGDYSKEPLLDALNTVKEWSGDGVFAKGSASLTVMQAQSLFATGGAAMLTDGSWAASAVAQAKPTFDFGWFTYPSSKSKSLFLTSPDNGVVVPTKAKNPVGAKLFVQFLAGKQAQELTAKAAGSIPVRTDLPASSLSGLEPQVTDMLSQMKTIGASDFWLPSGSVTNDVTAGFAQIITGEKTPHDLATAVQADAVKSRAAK